MSEFAFGRRPITWSDEGLSMDQNGVVWHGLNKHQTTSVHSRHGVLQLAVLIKGKPELISRVLSYLWYESAFLLPRNGSAMDYSMANTIVLKMTQKSIEVFKDVDQILHIWQAYCRGAGCREMSEKTGLRGYSIDEYKCLIRDILISSVRV